MKLSTKARYAVMALLDMLKEGMEAPVSLVSISERQNLPLPYLEQIFSKLRKSNIVTSARGSQGGYILSRHSSEITLYDIIISVDKEFKSRRCLNVSIGCQPGGIRCLTHDLWAKLDNVIEHFFKSLTLNQVLSRDVANMVFFIPTLPNELQTNKEVA
ncbi:MAG: Rrf2 family transcriptional regulator [Candidatus Paracaedibacteraceae bacterium]|nr:Rrf2 family transcriptional regulator [Candidatus Paracaedibacteraceae bacterium]